MLLVTSKKAAWKEWRKFALHGNLSVGRCSFMNKSCLKLDEPRPNRILQHQFLCHLILCILRTYALGDLFHRYTLIVLLTYWLRGTHYDGASAVRWFVCGIVVTTMYAVFRQPTHQPCRGSFRSVSIQAFSNDNGICKIKEGIPSGAIPALIFQLPSSWSH